jgi:hypothetical protein
MVQFTTTLQRFEKQGEKTGWTYIEIPADIAQKIKPKTKTGYRVKGKLDSYRIAIGKRYGAMVKVQLEEDKQPFKFNKDFMECLADEPAAKTFFNTLSGSHQRYFSKWIDSAKTDPTKTKRIAMAVTALSKKQGYPEMIRSHQKKNLL